MPKFVIQQHTWDNHTHWDLMLEQRQHLATWQIPIGPAEWSAGAQNARKIPNHRLEYLTYQGPISGDRGMVTIADQGDFEPVAITENCWLVRLTGKRLNGQLELLSITDDQWCMTFSPDPKPASP
jgi:hypothetical protein